MGPRDHPRLFPDGAVCTACGATVPTDRIRVLAERDDLAFVELACADCGSAALGLLTDLAHDGDPKLDVAGELPVAGEFPVLSRDGGAPSGPVSLADVESIHRSLARWRGDLVGWLAAVDSLPIDQGRQR
jgi:hypothetical protein